MPNAIFTAGLRTPFGRAFKGAYTGLRPDDMLIDLLQAHAKRYPGLRQAPVDDLITGCAYPEGEQGYNVSRMVALGSGMNVPGVTVNRLCASSLEAAAMAAARVKCGWGQMYVVAGLESMSRIPRRGANWSESERVSQSCPEAYIPNGLTAENVARRYPHITRERQEDLAAASHQNAGAAFDHGKYRPQIHPLLIERDELVRLPVDRNKMAGLQPAFVEDGVVTAATSSPLTDGATCGMVLEAALARSCGVQAAVEIVDATVAHVPPNQMGMGPVPATRAILQRNRLDIGKIAVFEINEAFAIQVLACMEELQIPAERVNTWGGAMALGHPLGASGLRLLITAHDRLLSEHETGSLALCTLCVGGGQGMSMLVRSIDCSRRPADS
jgi:acetyl-CoA acyltransferase